VESGNRSGRINTLGESAICYCYLQRVFTARL